MPVGALGGMDSLGRWPRTFASSQPLSLAISSNGCSFQVYGSVAAKAPPSSCWTQCQPQRKADCKAPRRTQLGLGKGRVLGEAAKVMSCHGVMSCCVYGGTLN